MTEQLYWVVIRAQKRRRRGRVTAVVKRIGPMSREEAEATRAGLSIDAHHKRFVARVEADRADYFARYHRERYENDEKYRVRKQNCARDWQERARAAARGDMTPWLTQD